MGSLFDSYKKDIKKSYYGIDIDVEYLMGGSKTSNNKNCREFIERHFEDGRKVNALNFDFYKAYYSDENSEDAYRHVHMVSLYLLGLLLRNIFEEQIKETISKSIDIRGWFDFKYTWFLTCLYHDTASFIEEKIPDDLDENKKQLSFWLEQENIKYTIYNHTFLKENAQFPRFSEKLIKNYFYYRMDHKSKDHGIVSGYILFNKLKENFLEKTRGSDLEEGEIIINNLSWRKEHMDHFAYIADAIICHNLWTAQAEEKEKSDTYKKYGLTPLIIYTNDNKLNFRDYPLQFMLCLLDTIEPVKRFKDKLSTQEILENINIWGDCRRIVIKWTDDIAKKRVFNTWKDSITSLENWMNVEVLSLRKENCQISCESGDCGLSITIK